MFKKIFNSLRNAKITYKLFFIFAVLFYVLINSWFFSYTTASDVEESYKNLEQNTLPSLLATNILKDNLHSALLAAYDYVSTGNAQSKKLYEEKFYDVTAASIELFNLSETQEELEFTTKFIDEQINDIRTTTEKLIIAYEADPNDPEIEMALSELSILRNDFNNFLEYEITAKIRSQIQTASSDIESRANRITYYLVLVVVLVVIIIIFLFVFISQNITKPVHILTEAAKQFGQGKFVEVKIDRKDELGLFAQTFNKMAKDISAAQKALREELEKTKEVDRQKSEFLSIAAHQLRTPMSGIKWMLKMTLDGDLGNVSDEQKHHLKTGLENSERMIALINSLLDVTRIEEQKFQYNYEIAPMETIISIIVDSLKTNAASKNIKLKVNKPEFLPPIKVDKEKIKIALTNLIDNAIKYSPKDSQITVDIKKEKDHMLISVADQGYGIPKAQQAHVFSKFFRGSNILKIDTEYESIGTGLGLYLTKDVVTKHEGEIWFESEENKGTTFYIKLPL